MPTAKKLPSGSWRVQVYSYTDSHGKKHKESFTAPTKTEAERMAAEWADSRDRQKRSDMTVYEAVQGYINVKTGVLSPSTIRGYDRMLRNNYDPIKNKKIRKLSSADLQLFVSQLSLDGKSAKTVSNIYGLLISAISLYSPYSVFKVTLPTKAKKRAVSPSDEDIQTLFNEATPTMQKCIALAAFGSLRRGEVCALTYGDIDGNIIHITKDMVQDKDRKWIIKDMPKTSESIRDAFLPDEIIELLGTGNAKDRIIDYKNPGSVTECFIKLRKRLGLNVRYHDLRAYFASIGVVLGIPTNYLEDYGGWRRGSEVMRNTYQNSIKSKSKEYSQRMADHFSSLISASNKVPTKTEKNVPTNVPTD